MTNFAVLQALPRIAEANPAEGYLHGVADGRAWPAAATQAQERMQAFLQGRGGKVQR